MRCTRFAFARVHACASAGCAAAASGRRRLTEGSHFAADNTLPVTDRREHNDKVLNLVSFREADDLRTDFSGKEAQSNKSHEASRTNRGKYSPPGDLQCRGRNQEDGEWKGGGVSAASPSAQNVCFFNRP